MYQTSKDHREPPQQQCHVHLGAAQDYDELNSSPYGTDQQAYESAFDTWEIEQASDLLLRRRCLFAQPG